MKELECGSVVLAETAPMLLAWVLGSVSGHSLTSRLTSSCVFIHLDKCEKQKKTDNETNKTNTKASSALLDIARYHVYMYIYIYLMYILIYFDILYRILTNARDILCFVCCFVLFCFCFVFSFAFRG